MRKHAEILAPKFAAVQEVLTRELGERNLATWTNPKGAILSASIQANLSRIGLYTLHQTRVSRVRPVSISVCLKQAHADAAFACYVP